MVWIRTRSLIRVPAESRTDALSPVPPTSIARVVGCSVFGMTTEIKDSPIVSLASTARGWHVRLVIGAAFAMDHCGEGAPAFARAMASTSAVPARQMDCIASDTALQVRAQVHDPKGHAIPRAWLERFWNNEDRTVRDLEEPVCHAAEEQAFQRSVFDIAKDNEVSIDGSRSTCNRVS